MNTMRNLLVVNGDFVFDESKNLVMVTDDAEELAQELTLTFQENAGEYFLSPNDGFPMYEILGGKFDRERAVDAAFEVLLRNPRVASVQEVNVDFDRGSRQLIINWVAIKADNGEITTGEAII